MSTIILNGNNSSLVSGLLIQNLSPISKPAIRTSIEEIDGRDGDIITKLGYSAYNKEISIGLYGNYDIDNIIAYFTNNQSGKVTFSDEPDKYYFYEIVDQIDFERLLRFRTATIKMHVQPFKYSVTDNKKIFNISSETSKVVRNSGNIYSKPKITIYGSGTLSIYLNNNKIFDINMRTYRFITIDTNLMEAYNGDTLLNRNVSGDYDKFKLNIGKNILSWSGTITKIEIEDYSRWI